MAQAFSDDFTRADNDSLGANWSEWVGDVDIISNAAVVATGGYGEVVIAYTGQATDTVNQYGLVSWTTTTGSFYNAIMLRGTDASSPMYCIFFWVVENKIEWTRKADAADAAFVTIESSGTITVDAADRWGVTIDGTGSNTVVRCWKNPTGNTPTAADDWGGDTTPDVTFTANPASPVDTGNYVGLATESNDAFGVTFDSFYGGDIPTGGGSTQAPRSMHHLRQMRG